MVEKRHERHPADRVPKDRGHEKTHQVFINRRLACEHCVERFDRPGDHMGETADCDDIGQEQDHQQARGPGAWNSQIMRAISQPAKMALIAVGQNGPLTACVADLPQRGPHVIVKETVDRKETRENQRAKEIGGENDCPEPQAETAMFPSRAERAKGAPQSGCFR